MGKVGRPRVEINQKAFENLCALQCTLDEIASFFNCSGDTIERWCIRTYKLKFAEIFRIKRQAGKISLRRSQFRLAEKYPQMAIFLGKNYLDQTDHAEITISDITDEQRTEVESFLNDNGTNEDIDEITE